MSTNNKVKYLDHNKIGRDFIVGDIHGCYDELMEALKVINFNKETDRLISVGDLIDRGPKNMECLELIYEPWFHAVKGNHEDMMIESFRPTTSNWAYETWINNGGNWHYSEDRGLLAAIAEDLASLPLVIVIGKEELNRYNIAHAEIFKAMDESLATDEDIDEWYFHDINGSNIIWGRSVAQKVDLNTYGNYGLSYTFCGHTPMKTPTRNGTHVFIDTGLVYGEKYPQYGNLTFAEIKDGEWDGTLHSFNGSAKLLLTTNILNNKDNND